MCFPLLIILYYVSPASTITQLFSPKIISGTIYDCLTHKPIVGARVSIAGVGWGVRDNLLVWDNVYVQSSVSNNDGTYSIQYNVGTEVSVNADEYLPAYYYTDPKKSVDIGMLRVSDAEGRNERTYQCQLESECMKEVVKDGVITSWDSCADPSFSP